MFLFTIYTYVYTYVYICIRVLFMKSIFLHVVVGEEGNAKQFQLIQFLFLYSIYVYVYRYIYV